MKNQVWWTGIFVYFELGFTACVACKILVQTRQKFQFIKLDFSNSIFQNPSADRYHEVLPGGSGSGHEVNQQKDSLNSFVQTNWAESGQYSTHTFSERFVSHTPIPSLTQTTLTIFANF